MHNNNIPFTAKDARELRIAGNNIIIRDRVYEFDNPSDAHFFIYDLVDEIDRNTADDKVLSMFADHRPSRTVTNEDLKGSKSVKDAFLEAIQFLVERRGYFFGQFYSVFYDDAPVLLEEARHLQTWLYNTMRYRFLDFRVNIDDINSNLLEVLLRDDFYTEDMFERYSGTITYLKIAPLIDPETLAEIAEDFFDEFLPVAMENIAEKYLGGPYKIDFYEPEFSETDDKCLVSDLVITSREEKVVCLYIFDTDTGLISLQEHVKDGHYHTLIERFFDIITENIEKRCLKTLNYSEKVSYFRSKGLCKRA